MTEFMDGAFCSRYRSTIEDHEKCGKKIYRGCVAYTQSNMLDASRLVTFFVFLASCSSIQVLDTANSRSAANYFPSSLQSGIQGEIPSSSQRPAPRQWGDLPKDDLEESVAVALRFFFELFEAAAVKNVIQEELLIFLSGDLTVKPTNLSKDVILRPGTGCPQVSDFKVHFKMTRIGNSKREMADFYIHIFDEEKMKEAFEHSCDKINPGWHKIYTYGPETDTRLVNAWNQLWVQIDHRSGDVSVHLRDGIDEYSAILFNVPSVLSTYQIDSSGSNMKLKNFSQLSKSDVTALCPLCMKFEAVFALVNMSKRIAADRLTVGTWGRIRGFIKRIVKKILRRKSIDQIWRRDTNLMIVKNRELKKWLKNVNLSALDDKAPPIVQHHSAVSFHKDGVIAVVDAGNARILHYSYDQELPKLFKESFFVTSANILIHCSPRSRQCRERSLAFLA